MAKKTVTVRDPWKAKIWYDVRAPVLFDKVLIGQTPASDPKMLPGRVIESNMAELTGERDMKRMRNCLSFKITSVTGKQASTEFNGFEITRDFERSLVRRKGQKISHNTTVSTKAGKKLIIKCIATAPQKVDAAQRREIFSIMDSVLAGMSRSREDADFLKDLIQGGAAHTVQRAASKIYPLRQVVIRKVQTDPSG